ncbi:MAG: hypothetical protein LBQ88_20240 [Treponema sp.]|nr:hypothetical protein [Treponema sp.]
MKQSSSPQIQRLWAMEHFRVLPTDPKVRELTDNQISLLLQYWLDYDEDHFRRAYREKKAIEQSKPQFDRQALYDMGYTDAEIDNDSTLRGD